MSNVAKVVSTASDILHLVRLAVETIEKMVNAQVPREHIEVAIKDMASRYEGVVADVDRAAAGAGPDATARRPPPLPRADDGARATNPATLGSARTRPVGGGDNK